MLSTLNNNLLKTLNYNAGHSSGIGVMGENLTVSILSLERAALTIKLLQSFEEHMPFFKGRFIIVDNGSSQETVSALSTYIQGCPQSVRLITARTNLGVAGGRNYSIEFVTTEWVMFLDNDIYIDASFLPLLSDEVNLIGAHFFSLPLKNPDGTFFAKGGELYITNIANKQLHIGGGNGNLNLQSPGLASFLFGGASVLKVSTFKKEGMFDQHFFIGYEDTDFSIRLWKNGYKVGYSTIKCFVHDHPVATKAQDINYEKERFSVAHIVKSANHAEQTHYFNFLSPQDTAWLDSKLSVYGEKYDGPKVTNNTTRLTHGAHDKKIGVAIIIDLVDWAYANIAFNLCQLNQDIFNFVVIPAHDPRSFNGNMLRVIFAAKDCQILHFMWRPDLFDLSHSITLQTKNHFHTNQIMAEYVDTKILSTCVYDHSMKPTEQPFIYHSFRTLVNNNYYVASHKLFDDYSNSIGLEKPLAVCQDGVDLQLFAPSNSCKFNMAQLQNRVITLGWAGNSRWGEHDHKGLYTIIKPVIERLINEGYCIRLEIADRNLVWREQSDMPRFYHSIDIYVCASLNEGTPNPVLEAMASGLIVVSTDVGIVREALGPLQQKFIVERTMHDFYKKLKYLLENKQQWQALSIENLQYIQSWDWSLKAQGIADYFTMLATANRLL